MALKDKVVVITGGAKGISRYNARLFASAGAKLAIADIESTATVASEVAERGAELLAVPTDWT
ncbi:MAG: SDR family NAD(P)-dependent oxidoreductase [Chloroflexi bacterium]|nr:SDR family NAD(P)-dependent oxidoreductase [Chloroflexota bacterium]